MSRTRTRTTFVAAAAAAALITTAACGSSSGSSASMRATAHSSGSAVASRSVAGYPDQAADKAFCATYNADLNNGDIAGIEAAVQEASGTVTPGLAKDMQAVVNGSSLQQDETRLVQVAGDCALVKVGISPQGFSSASPGS